MLKYCVYVLLSEKDNKFYIGYTSNLNKRINNHKNGDVLSTAPRKPLKLMIYEYFLSEQDALRREKYFKITAGKKVIKLMMRETLK